MTPLLTPSQLALWHQLLPSARHIVITCHRGPDGDAIGSTTALASWLRRHYPAADIHIIAPNIFPDFLKWIPGAEDILIYDKHEEEVRPIIEAADLFILCDHGELKRMWILGDAIRPRLPIGQGLPLQPLDATHTDTVRCIMIDHHLDPEPGIADLVISHPELSSTCEVLLRVMLEVGRPTPPVGHPSRNGGEASAENASGNESLPLRGDLEGSEATSLYTGMMTDTGAFTYASSRPEIYELISILLHYGIDKDKIYRNIFYTYSPNRMKLMGYLLYVKLDVWKKAHTSVMTFTNAERRRFGTLNGDTEGFVNLPLQILGMKLSVFLREDTEHPCIRVSLRSVDDFPCNEMAAEFFGGGGHKNAAGGEVWGTMDDALALVKKAVQKYMPLLKEGENK
ncbi:MAG: bifunctional oligoribonuclease/PAP phosphatase NrnA [Bacteroidaceae bacterium]|nr:bifunctional oligoribonuclease/PAP phosphatase NrnA [Bacteroidaceae bacterium]MBR1800784.1 bifunctional oligoribonuclease/PAP phosphatase NrnA [Bacteroidaceae bacterium]